MEGLDVCMEYDKNNYKLRSTIEECQPKPESLSDYWEKKYSVLSDDYARLQRAYDAVLRLHERERLDVGHLVKHLKDSLAAVVTTPNDDVNDQRVVSIMFHRDECIRKLQSVKLPPPPTQTFWSWFNSFFV